MIGASAHPSAFLPSYLYLDWAGCGSGGGVSDGSRDGLAIQQFWMFATSTIHFSSSSVT